MTRLRLVVAAVVILGVAIPGFAQSTQIASGCVRPLGLSDARMEFDPGFGYQQPRDQGLPLSLRVTTNSTQFSPVLIPVSLTPPASASQFRAAIVDCDARVVRIGDALPVIGGTLDGAVSRGIGDLVARDPAAYWDPTANEGTGGVLGSAFDQSPRVVLLPVVSPPEFMSSPVSIVGFVGFFVVRADQFGVVEGYLTGWSTLAVSSASVSDDRASLTAVFTGPGSPVEGIPVEFRLDGNSVGSASTDNAGVASLADVDVSGLSPGTHVVEIRLGQAAGFFIAYPAQGELAVPKHVPSVAWSSPTAVVYGTSLSDAQLNATTDTPGTFTYTPGPTTVLHAGQHTISVNFTPSDQDFYENADASVTLDVTPAPLIVRADSKTKVYSAPVPALTVSYEGFVNPDTPAALSGTLLVHTTATEASSVGSYPIDAEGLGSPDYTVAYQPGILAVVPAETTTSLASAANPSTYGQSVTITVSVVASPPASGAVQAGSVTFMDGSAVLGVISVAGGQAALTVNGLVGGTHSFTASFAGSPNYRSSSAGTLYQVVSRASSAATLTAGPNPSSYGQAVNLTASVTSPAGIPVGLVRFRDGSAILGTASLAAGISTLALDTLTGGNHALSVEYLGNGNFNPSSSSAISQTVNRVATTTVLSADPNPSRVGQPLTLTAVVTAATPTPLPPSGPVTFTYGKKMLGTAPLSGGVATFTTASLDAGTYALKTSYGGDVNFLEGTSNSVSQQVKGTGKK